MIERKWFKVWKLFRVSDAINNSRDRLKTNEKKIYIMVKLFTVKILIIVVYQF